jgi:hypothetical protein
MMSRAAAQGDGGIAANRSNHLATFLAIRR